MEFCTLVTITGLADDRCACERSTSPNWGVQVPRTRCPSLRLPHQVSGDLIELHCVCHAYYRGATDNISPNTLRLGTEEMRVQSGGMRITSHSVLVQKPWKGVVSIQAVGKSTLTDIQDYSSCHAFFQFCLAFLRNHII